MIIVLLGGRGEGGGGEHAGSSHGVSTSSGGNNFDQSAPEPQHAPPGVSDTDEDIPAGVTELPQDLRSLAMLSEELSPLQTA